MLNCNVAIYTDQCRSNCNLTKFKTLSDVSYLERCKIIFCTLYHVIVIKILKYSIWCLFIIVNEEKKVGKSSHLIRFHANNCWCAVKLR